MITLSYAELVEVFKRWNAEVVADPSGPEMDFEKVSPEKQADHFISTLATITTQELP